MSIKWCPFVLIKDYQSVANRVDSPGNNISTDCLEEGCAAWVVDIIETNIAGPGTSRIVNKSEQPGRCGMVRNPGMYIRSTEL